MRKFIFILMVMATFAGTSQNIKDTTIYYHNPVIYNVHPVLVIDTMYTDYGKVTVNEGKDWEIEISLNMKDILKGRPYIIASAIWFDDGKRYEYQPKNIETGLVLCGHRHCTIFQQIGGLVGERKSLGIYEKEQGFLTSDNRFVNRVEAADIARSVGQITDENIKILHSEDLW